MSAPGELFDVFVVGAADPSPAGLTALVDTIAGKNKASAPIVAKAIGERNLRVGQGVPAAQAEALSGRLRAAGAIVETRAHGAAPPPRHGSVPLPGPPSLGNLQAPPETFAGPGQPSGQPTASAPRRVPPVRGTILGIGSPMAGLPRSSAPPAGPPSASLAAIGTSATLFAALPGATGAGRPGAAPRPPTPAPSAPAGGHIDMPGLPRATPEPALELDYGAAEPPTRKSSTWGGNGNASLSLPTPTTVNVAAETDDQNPHLQKCAKHGLTFDRRKASGCRRCLDGARKVATRIEEATSSRRLRVFEGSPAKRAFVGLAFALVIGMLPAVYHALRVAAHDLRDMRAQQEELSRRAGTQDVLARFDILEERIAETHGGSMRTTGLIWLAVSTAAMFAWYRVTV